MKQGEQGSSSEGKIVLMVRTFLSALGSAKSLQFVVVSSIIIAYLLKSKVLKYHYDFFLGKKAKINLYIFNW